MSVIHATQATVLPFLDISSPRSDVHKFSSSKKQIIAATQVADLSFRNAYSFMNALDSSGSSTKSLVAQVVPITLPLTILGDIAEQDSFVVELDLHRFVASQRMPAVDRYANTLNR